MSSGAKVGDYVTFGKYEQDNILDNGKEDIEWLVLDIQGDKALLISKYGLDCKQYNEERIAVTWETCTLRKWLNNEFLNNAFDMSEQNRILTSEVTAEDNEIYGTDAGNDTDDKIFLLSFNEVNEFFASDNERKCAAIDYAKGQGARTSNSYTTDGKASCWWWLRSPGIYSDEAVFVDNEGHVFDSGYGVSLDDVAVRPSLWVILES